MLRSNCRTLDAGQADFFFVPFYQNGWQREAFDPPILNAEKELEQGWTEVMREITHGYFDAYRRRDHVFLFAHEFWGARRLWHRDHVSKAILLVSESNPLDMKRHPGDEHIGLEFEPSFNINGTGRLGAGVLRLEPSTEFTEHCLDCFDQRKDMVVPQHIDFFAIDRFSAEIESHS